MAAVIHHALEDLHVTVRGGKVQRERRYAIRCGVLDGEAHTSEEHATCPECLEAIRREEAGAEDFQRRVQAVADAAADAVLAGNDPAGRYPKRHR